MPAIGRRLKDHTIGATGDPAIQYGLQRLVASITGIERQIVAEQDETSLRLALEQLQESWQRGNILAL